MQTLAIVLLAVALVIVYVLAGAALGMVVQMIGREGDWRRRAAEHPPLNLKVLTLSILLWLPYFIWAVWPFRRKAN